MSGADFSAEYSPEAAVRVKPRGHAFELFVPPRYEAHYVGRDYEHLTARLVVGLMRRRRLFVDVGAHAGFFSMLVATRCPTARVVAIEPIGESRRLLHRSASANGVEDRVRTVEAAASDRTGVASIHLHEASDSAGFHLLDTESSVAERPVRTIVLDEELEAEDFDSGLALKIDAEGHELRVLEGSRRVLERAGLPPLVVEWNPKRLRQAGSAAVDLPRVLRALGYEVFGIDEVRRRFERLRHPESDRAAEPGDGATNLYCVARRAALSLAVFAHSAGLHGAERSLLDHVTVAIEEHGTVCSVVLPGEGPLRRRLEEVGAATLLAETPWWCDFVGHGRAVFDHRTDRGLAALGVDVLPFLRAADPDVVESMTIASPWGATAAALLDCPHVWSICEYGSEDHGLVFDRPFAAVRHAVVEASNLILFPSRRLAEWFSGAGAATGARDAVVVIPRGSRHMEWGEGSPQRGIQSQAGRVALRVIVLGAIAPGKGLETVLRATALLVQRGQSVTLEIQGDPQSSWLAKLTDLAVGLGIEDRVRFAGFVDDPGGALRGAGALIVAAPREAFGRTPLEAAAAGVPAVIAETSGIAEFLARDQDALWFRPGDPNDLADCLERLATEPDLGPRLVAGARRQLAGRLALVAIGAERQRRFLALRGAPNPLRGDRFRDLVAGARSRSP